MLEKLHTHEQAREEEKVAWEASTGNLQKLLTQLKQSEAEIKQTASKQESDFERQLQKQKDQKSQLQLRLDQAHSELQQTAKHNST